jgi:integrase
MAAAEQTRPPFGIIVRLLILTGQRRGETSRLRPEYVDRKKGTITFPGEIVKNGRTHTIPLGNMVSALLPEEQHGFLFVARGRPEHPFNGWGPCKDKLDKKCGVDFDLHDLRRTFASQLAELGIAPHIIERLLNHAKGQISGVAAIYNRYSYLPEMRTAIALWEDHLTELLAADDRLNRAA